MDNNRLQAQVRSLTRDVGALREALRQEEKKRERLAAHAKSCDEVAAGATAQVKQLTYVNNKLEQELHTVRQRADAAASKSRGGLEAVRGRLAEVEQSVHRRSVVAYRYVQRLHSLVQDMQATAMPLAVAVAAAAPGPPAAATLKSPLPGGSSSSRAVAAQRSARQPEQLHRQFSSIFNGLSQLAALFSGDGDMGVQEGVAGGGGAAPLLLTAPDGSTKAVRWQDQSNGTNCAGPSHKASAADGSTLGGVRPAGSATAAAAAAASSGTDRERLATEVHRLRAALAEARHRASVAEASSSGPGGSRVEEAMRQLDAVIPQYRAAAHSLQGQVHVLKEKLVAVQQERVALQEEVVKWRGTAQKHEAAFAEAAAKLHTQEAQSLVASTQVQSQADRLQSDVEGLRRRCSELAARLQESQRTVTQLQGSLAAKEKLADMQQQTIAQLEGRIREQQADIRSALDLVSSRPGTGAVPGPWDEELVGLAADGVPLGAGDSDAAGFGVGAEYYSSSGWQAEAGCGIDGEDSGAGVELRGGSGRLSSLLDAATATADAAATWAGGYGEGAATGTAASDWAGFEHGRGDPAAAWSIPAVGSTHSWQPSGSYCSPQACLSRPASPSKSMAAGLGPRQQSPQEQQHSKGRPLSSAAQSLQDSPACQGLACVEADIAGLEAALRTALRDLQV